jgi:hypothetical protein
MHGGPDEQSEHPVRMEHHFWVINHVDLQYLNQLKIVPSKLACRKERWHPPLVIRHCTMHKHSRALLLSICIMIPGSYRSEAQAKVTKRIESLS